MAHPLYQPTQDKQVADRIYKTSIDGLLYLDYNFHGDDRGFFSEIAILDDLNQLLEQAFVPRQMNLARSQQHVARGMHAEDWNKLITVVSGTAFCAIADIRPGSTQVVQTFLLGDQGLRGCVYVPRGLANSYVVTQGPMNYFYTVDALYRDRDTSGDRAVSLFDPDLGIDWPVNKDEMILSDRDKNAMLLKDL
jgi:dTDP-4-dehydrorhamnose 3,5-epimerase-like enzyme